MKIQYEDEYGETLHIGTGEVTIVPTVGDFVILNEEDYRVKSVTWMIDHDFIVVMITQNMVKSSKKEDDNSGRLSEMHNAIVALNKRQDSNEKKSRALTEQITTVRKHINQRIQQDKKDANGS
jgi:hypothetical protein